MNTVTRRNMLHGLPCCQQAPHLIMYMRRSLRNITFLICTFLHKQYAAALICTVLDCNM